MLFFFIFLLVIENFKVSRIYLYLFKIFFLIKVIDKFKLNLVVCI